MQCQTFEWVLSSTLRDASKFVDNNTSLQKLFSIRQGVSHRFLDAKSNVVNQISLAYQVSKTIKI